MSPEDRAEMRLAAVAAVDVFERVEVCPGHIIELIDTIARYQAALEWYADPENWDESTPGYLALENPCNEEEGTFWEPDCGDRARAALKGGGK